MSKADQMMAYNENAFKNFDEQALVQCPNCARTFLADRLQIHLKSCKAGKPLKMRAGLEPKEEKELSNAERRILGKVPLKNAPMNSDLNTSNYYQSQSYGAEETKIIERPIKGGASMGR